MTCRWFLMIFIGIQGQFRQCNHPNCLTSALLTQNSERQLHFIFYLKKQPEIKTACPPLKKAIFWLFCYTCMRLSCDVILFNRVTFWGTVTVPPKIFPMCWASKWCELGPVSSQPESQQLEPKGQTKPALSGAVCKHPHLTQTDNLYQLLILATLTSAWHKME